MESLALGQIGSHVPHHVVVEFKYDLVNVITLHPKMGAKTAKGLQSSQENVTRLPAQVNNKFLIWLKHFVESPSILKNFM